MEKLGEQEPPLCGGCLCHALHALLRLLPIEEAEEAECSHELCAGTATKLGFPERSVESKWHAFVAKPFSKCPEGTKAHVGRWHSHVRSLLHPNPRARGVYVAKGPNLPTSKPVPQRFYHCMFRNATNKWHSDGQNLKQGCGTDKLVPCWPRCQYPQRYSETLLRGARSTPNSAPGRVPPRPFLGRLTKTADFAYVSWPSIGKRPDSDTILRPTPGSLGPFCNVIPPPEQDTLRSHRW
jgi:hypothetical protein